MIRQPNSIGTTAMRTILAILASLICTIATAAISAADPVKSFEGEWRTTIGVVKLQQKGEEVTGTYGINGQFPLKGTVKDNVLTFEYTEGQAKGDGRFTLDRSGNAFTGTFQIRNGRRGDWNGWRPDPKATAGKAGSFAGLWLTDLGLMDLSQEGSTVTGQYALRGTSKIEGKATGRRLDFRFTSFRNGQGWFDLSPDGKSLSGAASTDGFPGWFGWNGRPAPAFTLHTPLVAGKIVDGSTANLLTYAIRAPEGYKAGDSRKWPTVLILHGSNMNAQSYVGTIAAAWPDIARDFIILGINGETPSDLGDDPRFNYTYVNYVGQEHLQRISRHRPRKPRAGQSGDVRPQGSLPDRPLPGRRPFSRGLPHLQPVDEHPRVDGRRVSDLLRRDLSVRARRLHR